MAGDRRKLEEAGGMLPWSLQTEQSPNNTVSLDFPPSGLQRTNIGCFKPL